MEGPEYETAVMLGSNCSIGSFRELAKLAYLCDQLGLDTISAGAVVAFAMECYEEGILSKDELGGIELAFGDASATAEMLERIAKREGVGNLLAEGVKKASEVVGKGSERFAMHVKGLEITGYDHRAARSMALAYATCDVGAHHNRAWTVAYDLEVGRLSYNKQKVAHVIYLQHVRSLFDALGVCRFPYVELELEPPTYARFFTHATGVRVTFEDLLLASERIYNLTRAINVRRGVSAKDDWLPERDFVEKVPSGKTRGAVLDREKFLRTLQRYYELRGWSSQGVPTYKKLKELGLEEVARVLGEEGWLEDFDPSRSQARQACARAERGGREARAQGQAR